MQEGKLIASGRGTYLTAPPKHESADRSRCSALGNRPRKRREVSVAHASAIGAVLHGDMMQY